MSQLCIPRYKALCLVYSGQNERTKLLFIFGILLFSHLLLPDFGLSEKNPIWKATSWSFVTMQEVRRSKWFLLLLLLLLLLFYLFPKSFFQWWVILSPQMYLDNLTLVAMQSLLPQIWTMQGLECGSLNLWSLILLCSVEL